MTELDTAYSIGNILGKAIVVLIICKVFEYLNLRSLSEIASGLFGCFMVIVSIGAICMAPNITGVIVSGFGALVAYAAFRYCYDIYKGEPLKKVEVEKDEDD